MEKLKLTILNFFPYQGEDYLDIPIIANRKLQKPGVIKRNEFELAESVSEVGKPRASYTDKVSQRKTNIIY